MIAGIADGTIDAIATDHAPHAFHEKQVEFERAALGIIGLETALPIALTVLHRHFKLPLWRIVELLSSNPARIFALEGLGTLSPGAHADVTIFDPAKKWTYDASQSKSKSRNTPYDGWSFTGKVDRHHRRRQNRLPRLSWRPCFLIVVPSAATVGSVVEGLIPSSPVRPSVPAAFRHELGRRHRAKPLRLTRRIAAVQLGLDSTRSIVAQVRRILHQPHPPRSGQLRLPIV